MSAVCPKCGVAVVPGYVKCPKCQAALPQRRATTQAAGGTSVGGEGISLGTIVLGLAVVGVVVAVFVLRSGGDKPKAVNDPAVVAPAENVAADPTPSEPEVAQPQTPGPAAKDPTSAIRALERALKTERLWATVEIVGSGIDVRSAACGEPTMGPVVDQAIPALRDAGVTKVRCLEQAGAVVFEREL